MKKLLTWFLILVLLLSACDAQAPSEPTEPAYVAQQPTVSATEPSSPEEILSYRRDLVEAEMRRTMTMLWTPSEDIVYSLNGNSAGVDADLAVTPEKIITLKAGRIYRGVPYTHGSGSAYSFLQYASGQDAHGVYTLTGLGSEDLSGNHGIDPWNIARIGTDCADCLFWAWAQVSGSISFIGTTEMTESYGCVKVGDYVCSLPKYTSSTKPVVKSNGTQVMYGCYAQLQKGDGLVLFTNSSGGHAVMVVACHVEHAADGSIDPEKSNVTIIETRSGPQSSEEHYYDEAIGQDVYICGAVDVVWSFETLYSKGYLPVTCKELIDPSPRVEESVTLNNREHTLASLFTDTLYASYRIAHATVTIYDEHGNVVQQATCFGQQKRCKELPMILFLDQVEQNVMIGSLDLQALEAGNYRCKVDCLLSTGRTVTAIDVSFTHTQTGET